MFDLIRRSVFVAAVAAAAQFVGSNCIYAEQLDASSFATAAAKCFGRDYSAAVAVCSQLLQTGSNLTREQRIAVLFGRAQANRELGNAEAAIADFDAIIDLDGARGEAYLQRGAVQLITGDHPHAIASFDRAIELSPDSVEAYWDRALAYEKMTDLEQAIVDLKRVVEIDPSFHDVHHALGICYQQNGDSDRALLEYDKAIQLNPKLAMAYYNRGALLASKGDLNGAMSNFSMTLDLEPKYAPAFYNRGVIYLGMDDVGGAIGQFDAAIAIDADYVEALFNRGMARFNIEEYDAAIVDLTRAIDLNDSAANGTDGNVNYAVPGKANRSLAKHLKSYALFTRAMAHHKKKEFDAAVADYRDALSIDRDIPDLGRRLALAQGSKELE